MSAETAAADVADEAEGPSGLPRRILRGLRAHWMIAAVLAGGLGLRVTVMLGYPSAMWFPDTMAYVKYAEELWPSRIRPIGYSFLLRLLEPFHSFGLVLVIQHLLGLGIAVLVYLLLWRRFGVPGWGAGLAAAPVSLDAFQVQVEHMIMSDVVFTALVVGAVAALLWRRRPGLRAVGVAGLLLGLAAVVRPVGLPFLALLVGYVLISRIGWRAATVALVAGLLPGVAYATWFHSTHDRFALSNSTGIFLYARVTTFVDCTKFTPPPGTEGLCPRVPEDRRRPAHWYIWAPKSEIRAPGMPNFFSYRQEVMAGDFAKKAILAQPGDYAATVWRETLIGFRWERRVFPDPHTYGHYVFDDGQRRFKNVEPERLRAYDPSWDYVRAVGPYSTFLGSYQRHFFLRGPLLAAILLCGAWAVARNWRRLGGPALLPWSFAMIMVILPPATVMFDYRYLLPVAPLACIAAALAFARRPADDPGTDRAEEAGRIRPAVPI